VYGYDQENRLVSKGSITYTHDKDGNLLSERGAYREAEYTYNGQNRMAASAVTDRTGTPSRVSTQYAYDAYGRRTITQDAGREAMRSVYDGLSFEVIREGVTFTDGSLTTRFDTGIWRPTEGNTEGQRYRWIGDESAEGSRYRWIGETEPAASRYTGISVTLYGRGEAVAISRSASTATRGGTAYLGKDALGSVRSATGSGGGLEDRYEYDAFGKPYAGDLTSGMNLGYTGKPYDAATGLYNYGCRDYQPAAARFTTIDPARDGSNWFAYVNNDPVNWIDPWGLSASDNRNKGNSFQIGQNMTGEDFTENINNQNLFQLNITLSTTEIGNIIFNETRSLSGENIQTARENIAHAIINAEERWGENRNRYAGTAPTRVDARAQQADSTQYESSQQAARSAVAIHATSDPTNGAVFFNFRSNDSRSDFQNAEIQTQVGPLANSYPTSDVPATGIYANTYRIKN
jgi:RHS repeat-associated protein